MTFLTYLHERRRVVRAYALFVLIFFVTFCLYHLPLGAVLYPALLCALAGLALLAIDYRAACRRHELLTRLAATPSAALLGSLPPPDTQSDADYQQLIGLLRGEYERFSSDSAARYSEMIDYYTIWAHQIKTPISSMRLHLQAEDTHLSRQLTADLFRIEQYVEMVLMFLRLDSDSSDYVFQSYELDGLVRACVKKFAGEFIRRKIRLDYQPLSARVITDEKWLSFVVEQVLSNALKYTHAGGSIAITLEAPQTLCIRDSGIGIEPEDLPRIFEKGYTGWNGRTDKQASGIGLYLCRRLCDALGHTIEAESAPGQGTCIRIGLERRQLKVE